MEIQAQVRAKGTDRANGWLEQPGNGGIAFEHGAESRFDSYRDIQIRAGLLQDRERRRGEDTIA